jgi:protein-tyrosine sulfotransferase
MSRKVTPIFLLGILERSGTNYLYDLIRAHPDVGVRRPIWEDKLLRQAQFLKQYAETVAATWDAAWNVSAEEKAKLLLALGSGLGSFVTEGADTSHVIVKTPSVENLPLFHDLILDAPLLVLVRDGRSVTESGVRSFGWSYPVTMKQWADAARTILDADPVLTRSGLRYRLVRYESVLADPRAELTKIFAVCGLDPERYDFDAAHDTPVRGSSTARPDATGPVDWASIDRPADFNPVNRFAGWDEALRALYAELAGEAHRHLGYPLDPLPPMTPAARAQVLRYRAELATKIGQRSVQRLTQRARRVAARRR